MRKFWLVLLLAALTTTGCGKPTLYPLSGKVTLGGKPQERLLVYFRPVSGVVTEYNMAVGETDKEGNLRISSSAGQGLAAGEYKVTFTCKKLKSGAVVGSSDKPDDYGNVVVLELVADDHVDGLANETTPVRFTVKPEANVFNYDVPLKKK
jgi:5-hydroxyisourate hydrolase-like protein (transthyretin family)